jgi:hypothetical protein
MLWWNYFVASVTPIDMRSPHSLRCRSYSTTVAVWTDDFVKIARSDDNHKSLRQ